MSVGEICERRIATAPVTMSALAAAKSMHTLGDRVLVVTGRREGAFQALGIVTDHELAGIIICGANPSVITVAEIMRPRPGFVTEDDGILETTLWMRHHGLREVIVNDRNGALAGIVSMERLIESLAADLDGITLPGAGAAAPAWRTAFH